MIRVNDRDKYPWEPGLTITRLLELCGYTSPQIAVFVDGEFVAADAYQTTTIADGANVRVLHLIAGG
jgi:sulfur carrier protein